MKYEIMRNKINNVTMKICVELDFKDIYFANCVTLYGNHRLMTGNILAAFSL